MRRSLALAFVLLACSPTAPASTPAAASAAPAPASPTTQAAASASTTPLAADAAPPAPAAHAAASTSVAADAGASSSVAADASDFMAVLSSPTRTVESTVKAPGKGKVRFSIALPQMLSEDKHDEMEGSRSYTTGHFGSPDISLSADEAMTLAARRHMAAVLKRTIVSVKQTPDGFVLLGYTPFIVEVVSVRRAKGQQLLCDATINRADAVQQKDKVFPLLARICASIEIE